MPIYSEPRMSCRSPACQCRFNRLRAMFTFITIGCVWLAGWTTSQRSFSHRYHRFLEIIELQDRYIETIERRLQERLQQLEERPWPRIARRKRSSKPDTWTKLTTTTNSATPT